MSFRSLHGPVSGSPLSLTIGSDGWLVTIIVLPSLFLVGPSTDRAAVGTLRPQMNFLTRLSLGLEIQIHGSERRGRRAKDWRSSSRIVEPYWFWTAWSRSKIRPGHKKDALREPSLQALMRELAAFNTGLCVITTRRRSLILQITSAPRLCVVTWNNYPAMPVRNCSERWVLKGMRRSCEVPATSSVATVSL